MTKEVLWSFLAAIMVILQRRFNFGYRKTKQRQLLPRIPQVKLDLRRSADVSVFLKAAEPGTVSEANELAFLLKKTRRLTVKMPES